MEATKGGAQKGGVRGPKFRAFFLLSAPIFILFSLSGDLLVSFFLSPGDFSCLFSSLWGSSRGILVVFLKAGTLKWALGLSCETPAPSGAGRVGGSKVEGRRGGCDVHSGTGTKDTLDESAQGKTPCEDNVNRGLVDGRVEGRIGVQVERVESEVVLICDGHNREGACVKIKCLVFTHDEAPD